MIDCLAIDNGVTSCFRATATTDIVSKWMSNVVFELLIAFDQDRFPLIIFAWQMPIIKGLHVCTTEVPALLCLGSCPTRKGGQMCARIYILVAYIYKYMHTTMDMQMYSVSVCSCMFIHTQV